MFQSDEFWKYEKPWEYPKDYREDTWVKPCNDPGHSVPNMMVFTRPYHHKCPSCGFSVTIFPTRVWC